MAATSTLLKLTPLQQNPSFSYTQQRHHPNVYFCSNPQLRTNVVRLQIDVKYKQSTRSDTYMRYHTNHAPIWKNSFDEILIQIKKTLDSLKKPVIATVLLGLLLFCNHKCVLAASGGRIGGSAFSSRSRSSESSSSSSKMYSKPAKSNSSSSSTTYSKPKNKKSKSSWFSAPSYSYSEPSTWDSAPSYSYSVPRTWDLAPSFSDLAECIWNPAPSILYLPPSFSYVFRQTTTRFILILFGFAGVACLVLNDNINNTQKTSVLKVQLGLLGSARTLQKDFNRLAEKADTSTPEGLRYVLTEATLALLRHPDYCISSYSSVDVKSSIEEGEKRFNHFSIEERGKFDDETLVNVNSVKIQSSKIPKASGLSNEYIVVHLQVTILVAAEGTLELQTIKGIEDLKDALQKLGSIPSNKILAVEVMWTPQNDKDVLSERELLEDYPLLKSF